MGAGSVKSAVRWRGVVLIVAIAVGTLPSAVEYFFRRNFWKNHYASAAQEWEMEIRDGQAVLPPPPLVEKPTRTERFFYRLSKNTALIYLLPPARDLYPTFVMPESGPPRVTLGERLRWFVLWLGNVVIWWALLAGVTVTGRWLRVKQGGG